MTTIHEIAAESNVSIATVSNILNGKGGASAETTKKVLQVARRLHYVPNHYAKTLKQGKRPIVGVITEDLTVFNTPEIVDGIDAVCAERGYNIVLGNLRLHKMYQEELFFSSAYHVQVKKELEFMLGNQVSGIIYVGCHSRCVNCLEGRWAIPVVTAYCYASEENIHGVVVDEAQGGYEGTKRLILAGHREIGVLAGPATSECVQERLLGYQRALFEHGILFNPEMVLYGPWDSASQRGNGRALLRRGVQAVLAMSDLIANDLMYDVAQTGLVVGKDLSIIAFNAQEVTGMFNPRLSTISLPLKEIGHTAAKMMLAQMEGSNEELPHIARIPSPFVDKGTIVHSPST